MIYDLINWLIPYKNKLFNIRPSYNQHKINKCWFIVKDNSATTEYYFRSRVDQFIFYEELCSETVPDSSHPIWCDPRVQIILSRDVSIAWLKALKANPIKPASIVWFIDDDIPGAYEDITLPKEYRRKLSRWYRQAFPLLESLCTDVWVSTPYLAEKYQLPLSKVLPPLQSALPKKPLVKCFYHGTSSHTSEWQFIYDFVLAVQSQYDHVWFELIGGHALKKQFEKIPRVSILHPMSWENYQAHITTRNMDIGLVPLFDSPFNRARSHTKMLDLQRQGAIGIYSSRFHFAEKIHNKEAGLISDDGLENWLRAFAFALELSKEAIHHNAEILIKELELSFQNGSILK